MSLATKLVAALVLVTGAACARTQPALVFDPPRGDVRLVVLADFNGPYGAVDYPAPLARAMAAITTVWLPDLLLSPGDVIAGQSHQLPDDRFAAMWAAFDTAVAEPLRAGAIAYAVAFGNHDGSSQTSGGAYVFERERGAAVDYWSSSPPALAYQDRAGYPFDYSFTHAVGPAAAGLFVVILDASSSAVTRSQREWLAAQLSSPAAVEAGARVVVGHLPLVPVAQGRDRSGEYVYQGRELGALLGDGSVDLYVSGHHAAFYPGRLGDVELLFAGGIGGRRLLGTTAAPLSTVTLVDVWLAPEAEGAPTFVYTTFDLADFTVVDPAGLPAVVGEVELSSRVGVGVRADKPPAQP